MITLIIFILVLGILVFVHELGHFFVARRNGVKAEEFGFGFPPRIGGFRKVNGKYKFFLGAKQDIESEDTIYSLNYIPLGGFVKIKGQGGENADDPDSFANKKVWPRFKILFAGVLMNFILAAAFLMIGFWMGLPTVIDDGLVNGDITDVKVQIISVEPNTPAQEAGLEIADAIKSINGQEVTDIDQVQALIRDKAGEEVVFEIEREGEVFTQTITPLKSSPMVEEGEDNPGQIGVALVRTGIKSYPWYHAIWMGIKSTVLLTGQIIVGLAVVIKNLIITQQAGVEVAGPVGIAVLTGKVAKMGIIYLLQFTALLSINLAVINLLPFPALDGGRILFLIIEKIRRKPVSQKVENAMHTIGFMLLILLMILITFKDVARFW